MITRKDLLTNAEMEVMEIIWNSEKPMSSNEILDSGKIKGWSSGYLHNVVRAMIKKGVLCVAGMIQNNTQYARQFAPAITRTEYAAKLVVYTGVGKNDIDALIKALEEIL